MEESSQREANILLTEIRVFIYLNYKSQTALEMDLIYKSLSV